MTFAAPAWFWAFAVFPFLLALALANERRREELLAKLVASRLAARLAGTVSVGKRRLRLLLLLAGLAAVIVTLARPQWGFTWEESKRKGRDVLLAIDTSRSMLADDVKPNRLSRAKLAAQDLISELQGDRVGVIAFAGTAFLQAPLTVDYGAVLSSIKELDTEIIPQGGSNVAGALQAAREAFGKGESENRALIIFSDGEELDADAKKVAEELKGQVRVFSVGIGTPDGALIPIKSRTGGTEFVKDPSGNVVRTRLDESKLRTVAEDTGGFYVHLVAGRPEMQQIVRDGLGKMTEQDIDARLSRRPIERFQWPLSAALVLLGAASLVGERRRLAVGALAAWILALSGVSASAVNQGVEAYDRKDYPVARNEFSRQLSHQPDRPEMQFNLGSAAYKQGDYDTALGAFSRAVTSSDPSLRGKAAYNLGNTLFQRGARQQEKEARVAEWKNAIQHYDEALKVDPKNEDAVYNREVVRKLLEEQEQKQQDQQKQDQSKKDDQQKDQKDQQQQQQQQQQQKDQQKQDQQNQDQDQQQKQDQQQQSGKDQQKQQDSGQGDQQKDQKDQQQQQQQKPEQGNSKDQKGEGQKDQQKPQGANGEQKDEQGKQSQQQDDKSSGQSKNQKREQNGAGQSGDQQKNEPSQKDQGDEQNPAQPQPRKQGDIKSSPQYGDRKDDSDQKAEELADAQAAADSKMTPQQAKALLESLKAEDEKVRLYDPRERRGPARVLKDW